MLSEEYSVKCGLMLSRIPDKMYVFEITKKCGYSEFVLVYKDSLVSELFTIASNQFSTNVNCLYFMNPETKKHYHIPNTNQVSMRELITSFQKNTEMQSFIEPIYKNVEFLVVYRLFYDDDLTECC
jgi:hypothetical protein